MKDKRRNGSVPNCLEKEIISRGSNLVHGLTNKQSGNDEARPDREVVLVVVEVRASRAHFY